MDRAAIVVRAVEPLDLDAILRIDERLSGRPRKEYWQQRLDLAALRPPWMSLVAETDGRVVGFLFGWIGEAEFGMAGPTAWVDLVGVDPPYRGRGVAQALLDRFVDSGRQLRAIDRVSTLIDLAQPDIREFFLRMGFRHGPMIQMERGVARAMIHPLDALREEHVLILRMLELVERATAAAAREAPSEAWWVKALAWLREFADASHHGKEEGALFPAMVKAGAPLDGGPIAVMLEEHEQGRALVRAMADRPADRGALARRYVGLLRDHIDKENAALFPIAEGMLDERAWRSVADGFERVAATLGRPGEAGAAAESVERLAAELARTETAPN